MNQTIETNILRRSFEISRISAVYFIFYKINRHKDKSLGVRMRLACEELGLVFIKLGQILSTRYDLLEREDCEELQKLLDEVPPMSYEIVQQIFLKDFGKLPQELYEEFNPQPIAAASIAQVYKAKLANDITVAVKVRRPSVDRAIRSDIRIFRRLARIAQWFRGNLRHIDLQNILSQLEEWLLGEVDFRHEVENMRRFADFYQNQPIELIREYSNCIVTPKAYESFCSENIIAMDFIEGVPFRQFQSIADNPKYDVFKSLKVFTGAFMRGWMYGDELIFQGDPHPSNLLILPDGKIAVLDFGLLGHLTKEELGAMKDLFLAVYAGSLDKSIEMSLKMCNVSHEKYAPIIREDVKRYLEQTPTSSIGFWFLGFVKIFIKYKLGFPYYLTMFARMGAVFEGLFQMIVPGITVADSFGDELRRALLKRVRENIASVDITPVLYVLSEKLKESPEKVAELIDKYFDDPLQAVRDFSEAIR